MSKPQAATEPSMEDILASIRKMISEDRMGPRPVPDQIARTSIGERAPAAQPPKAVALDRTEAPKAAEPPADTAAAASGETSSSERSVPSFSSLSDALKSAAPGTSVRRALHDKLAGMIDDEDSPRTNGRAAEPARTGSAPPSPLAVFAGARASPAPSAIPQPGNGSNGANGSNAANGISGTNGAGTMPARAARATSATDVRPERSERTQPTNGVRVHTPLKPVPEPSRARPAPTNGAALNKPAAQPTNKSGNQLDTSNVAPATAATAASRPAPKAAPVTPAAPPAEANEKAPEAQAHNFSASGGGSRHVRERKELEGRASLNVPEAPKADPAPGLSETNPDAQRIIAMPARFPTASSQSEAAGPTNGALNGARASVFGLRPASGQSPAGSGTVSEEILRADETVKPEAAERAHAPAVPKAAAPQRADLHREHHTAEIVGTSLKPQIAEPAEALQTLKDAVTLQPEDARTENVSEPAAQHAPSESLVDAVMNLVHSEPAALSVFTSGASFIHGVGLHEVVSRATASLADPSPMPSGARKLDNSAAELLRPMLRQWLADNMPRIVEEALRSELISSQGEPDPADKA